jgi:predicted 3-demethylubiquinone-9 3-methyltransferase (glyoxalase superfamily)
MQKITPFLWFDGRAEEAAKFSTSMLHMDKLDIQGLQESYTRQ